MKKSFFALILGLLLISPSCLALDDLESSDLSDFIAIYIFLRQDCNYTEISGAKVRSAILYLAARNKWDLSNYNEQKMRALGEKSYDDLKKIPIPQETKCRTLARDSLGLLSYLDAQH